MAAKLLQYDVLDRLGEGAKSVIYLVNDPTTRRNFALKHVLRLEPKDIRFIEQVENEYEISRQFTHPNLRKSFLLKVNKSMLLRVTEAFLVMELFNGRPLDVRPPQGLEEIVDTFIQAAEGLRALHTMGYIHCDLKPNNILRDDAGQVKVIDFGQSCKIGTVKERIQGTPDYISPEQVARRPLSIPTDVFNLGATLYWCLTFRSIPTAYTANKKGENSFLVTDMMDTPKQLNPKVPDALSNFVMECVSTNMKRRPADMDQVLNRLELVKHVLQKQAAQASRAEVPEDRSPEMPDEASVQDT